MFDYICLCCGETFVRKQKTPPKKQFCKMKCKYAITSLMLFYSEEEAIKIHNNYYDSKKRTLATYIKLFGEIEGPIKYNNYISRHKKSLSEEGYIEKYGEELGKQKWQEYCESLGVSEEKYIKLYGEELGKQKWQEYCESRVRDVKLYANKIIINEKSFIEKYGEEPGKQKWQATSLKKKKTMARNFELKNSSDEIYELYIMEFEKYIKIGISKNSEKRFKCVSKSLNESGKLTIFKKDTYFKIRNLEKFLHNKFDQYNIILNEKINGFTEFFDKNILNDVLNELYKTAK